VAQPGWLATISRLGSVLRCWLQPGYLGGGVNGSELLALATGIALPKGNEADRAFTVASTLHMLVIEAGYEWHLFDHFTIRGALGFAGVLGATTEVTPDYAPRFPVAVESFTADSEVYLNDIYISYVFTPTITVGLGYRFF